MATEALFDVGFVKCVACDRGLTGTKKLCYACKNNLTGKEKHDWSGDYDDDLDDFDDFDCEPEIWECRCETWECRCRNAQMAWCPICERRFAESAHLAEVFADDERARWLANMVTHYRHEHRAWDRNLPFLTAHRTQETYEQQKAAVNEQAKRQIIRKGLAYLIHHGIHTAHFQRLHGTTEKTIELANKKIPTPLNSPTVTVAATTPHDRKPRQCRGF